MRRGQLDRIVQFRRATLSDDGFGKVETWADYGPPMPASKTDVSDGERWRAQEVSSLITTRFVIRWNATTIALTPKDALICEGRTYNIVGIKELPERRRWLEITAAARSDK